MTAWKYNETGADGKPAILLPGDPLVTAAYVASERPRIGTRRREEQFPGLSGAGATGYGLTPGDIVCHLTLLCENVAGLRALMAKFLAYRDGRAYTLVTEWGETFEYVGFVDLEPGEQRPRIGAAGQVIWQGRLLLRWMQPI